MFAYKLWKRSHTKHGMIVAIITKRIRMKQDTFNRAAGIIFLIIALLHLARLIYGWEAAIVGVSIPMWASVLAVAIAGYLGSYGLQLSKR